MRIEKRLALLTMTFCFPALAAEEQPKTNPESNKTEPTPVFYFRDQSKVTGQPQFEAMEVKTPYGTLSIPRDQLIQVRFALRLADDVRAHIQQLIEELGGEDFDKREAATEALKAIGAPALDALQKGTKSENEEVKNRSQILVDDITKMEAEASAQVEDSLPLLSGSDDEVVTTRMTVKGTILHETIAIKSRYGQLEVKASALAGIVFRGKDSTSAKVAVQASSQAPGNWLDTKLDLAAGEKFKLTATGQISVSNYSLVSAPEGVQGYPNTFGGFPSLALVGKIGKGGNAFLVASNYKGKAAQGGRLYLAVVPFVWNPGGASGSYQVKAQTSGK